MTTSQPRSTPYPLIGLVWLVAVIVLGATGQIATLRPPAPQLVLVGLTVALLLVGTLLPGFRIWLAGINLRQLVALHITRFVGIYFLILYGRGELPFEFAVPGGWGDIVIATGALGLVLLVPDLTARRSWLFTWNLLGLADILFVVGTAARLGFTQPESLAALLQLPLCIVPLFLVPIIISSHVLLFTRLRRERLEQK